MKQNRVWQFALIALALVAVVAIWFYYRPQFYANVDEHNYLRNAWKLANYQDLSPSDPTQALGGFPTPAGYISKYNLGNSIWLSSGQLLFNSDIASQLLLSLAAYLLIIVFSYWLLRQLKLPPVSLLAIILFPPLIYFSRTAFSENLAAVLFTASCGLLVYWHNTIGRKRSAVSALLGFCLGGLVLVRYNYAIWGVLVFLLLLFRLIKQKPAKFTQDYALARNLRQSLAAFVAGALPCAILFLIINSQLYSCLLCSGYKFSGEESFNLSLIVQRLPEYLLKLNLLYPALFIVPLAWKHYLAKMTMLLAVLMLLFYSAAGGFLYQESILVDVTAGNRFFLPLMPVLIICYLSVLLQGWRYLKQRSKLLERFGSILLIAIAFIFSAGGIVGVILVSRSHNAFIAERAEKAEAISSFIKQNPGKTMLFLGDEEDYIYFGEQLGQDMEKVGYLSVPTYQDNQELRQAQAVKDIYLLQISYDSRTDRPTLANNQFLQNNAEKLQLVSSKHQVTIYKYKQLNQ